MPYLQGIFDEQLARLYTAEIVLAIAHLHSLGFVHRDLKPVSASSLAMMLATHVLMVLLCPHHVTQSGRMLYTSLPPGL